MRYAADHPVRREADPSSLLQRLLHLASDVSTPVGEPGSRRLGLSENVDTRSAEALRPVGYCTDALRSVVVTGGQRRGSGGTMTRWLIMPNWWRKVALHYSPEW